MTALENKQLPMDAEVVDSRIGRIDPDIFRSQETEPSDEQAEENGSEESDSDDEPTDEEGDPTGEHDHHQDDNYALGGHVTRSGGL